MQIFQSTEEPERNSETWGRGQGAVLCGVKATKPTQEARRWPHPLLDIRGQERSKSEGQKKEPRCGRSLARNSQTPKLSRPKKNKKKNPRMLFNLKYLKNTEFLG